MWNIAPGSATLVGERKEEGAAGREKRRENCAALRACVYTSRTSDVAVAAAARLALLYARSRIYICERASAVVYSAGEGCFFSLLWGKTRFYVISFLSLACAPLRTVRFCTHIYAGIYELWEARGAFRGRQAPAMRACAAIRLTRVFRTRIIDGWNPDEPAALFFP